MVPTTRQQLKFASLAKRTNFILQKLVSIKNIFRGEQKWFHTGRKLVFDGTANCLRVHGIGIVRQRYSSKSSPW